MSFTIIHNGQYCFIGFFFLFYLQIGLVNPILKNKNIQAKIDENKHLSVAKCMNHPRSLTLKLQEENWIPARKYFVVYL